MSPTLYLTVIQYIRIESPYQTCEEHIHGWWANIISQNRHSILVGYQMLTRSQTSSSSKRSALYSMALASSSFIFQPPDRPPTTSFCRELSKPTSWSCSRILSRGICASALSTRRTVYKIIIQGEGTHLTR